MRYFWITFLFIIITSSSFAQKLNSLGKIDIDEIPQMPDHRVDRVDDVYKINTDSFQFEGNAYYKTPNGFITSLEVADNEKDFIKKYDSQGNLLVTILSDRIINLKLSDDGSNLVFYNSNNIILINLNNYKIDTLAGSFVYSFIGSDLIYYDSDQHVIRYKGNSIKIEAYPNQFVDYSGRVLVISKKNIFELLGNTLIDNYEFKGNFFDAKIIENEFYFVDRIEKRKTESYTLYKTSDFKNFKIVDKLDDLNR